jgi:ornithine cyclodeaminase/alanine dehydrogenase-like protein (mu-crystallin family)
MPECIRLMEEALASLARGEVVLPLRPVLRVPDTANVFALMPAYSSALPALGAKLITVFPGNHGTGRDSHQGVVVLFDAAHGGVAAVMDAASITAIRTAAASGVATRVLANEDVTTLGVFGSGVQASTHVAAMLAVRTFIRVLVWSRHPPNAEALAERLRPSLPAGTTIDVERSAEAVARAADVVCTVTASREPVLQGGWLREGAHVNAVGASVPAARELDTAAVARARLFVDRRESALNEAGDILIPIKEGAITAEHIVAELGEVLIGKAAGRRSSHELTVFKSLGIAIEDLACARFLVDEARREGSGTWIEL